MSSQSSAISRRLRALFNIQPGEGQMVGMLVLLYLSLTVAVVFVQTIAFSLFVVRFGSQNLPIAYIATAALASCVALIHLRLSKELEYRRLLLVTIAFCGVVCALMWLGLNSPWVAAFIFLLPVWFQIQINMTNLTIWPLAGRLFDLRQGKRLHGIVGAGNWIANVIGGIIVAPLVLRFGTSNMLLIAVLALMVSALIMWVVTRIYLQHPPHAKGMTKDKPKAQQGRKPVLIHSRYVALIIAYVCLWWVSFFFIDLIFYDRASLQFPSAVQLTAFLGAAIAVRAVIALFVTTVLSSRILQRYGLRAAGLILMPALVTVFIAATAVFGTLGAAVVVSFAFATFAKVANVSLGFSLSQSANGVMYQALPGEERMRVQTTAEGIVQPISIGIAGVLLLVLNTWLHLGAIRIAFIFLPLAAGWLTVIMLLAREYPHALLRVLVKRQFSEPQTFVADASAVNVLTHELNNPKAGVALYAMNMLGQMAPAALSKHLAGMLDHPSAEVREAALNRIETMMVKPAAEAVRLRLGEEESSQVKSAALRALAAIDDEADESLAIYLRDDDAVVAKGALVGLLRHGDANAAQAAHTILSQWAQSEDTNKRLMAARVIGEANVRSACVILERLLSDSDLQVRRTALNAASVVKDAALWPQVIHACDTPESAKEAMKALAHGNAQTLELIQYALQDTSRPHGSRVALAEACCRIEDAGALPVLENLAMDKDAGVRSTALAALVEHRIAVDPASARACIRDDAAHMAWMCAVVDELAMHPPHAIKPLIAALQAECDAARDAIMYGGAGQRAYALEVIDAQLPSEMKGWVMPAIESLPPSERLARWRSTFPVKHHLVNVRVREIMLGDQSAWLSAWTKACALYAIAQLPARDCLDAIELARKSPEPELREMAVWAGMNLDSPAGSDEYARLSIVERVMILKDASMFAQTPDKTLSEVAARLEDVNAGAGETLFSKGDMGDCLYVIVSGCVLIHDGERLLNDLGPGEVFGEMALLEPEPRLASATVSEQSRLLRLDRGPFYELITERPEVSIGIIHMLTGRLRARVQDIGRLDAQLRAVAGATQEI